MRKDIRTEGPTDRHDEINNRFSQFLRKLLKFFENNKLSAINLLNLSIASISISPLVQTTVSSEPIRTVKGKLLFLPNVKSKRPDFTSLLRVLGAWGG